MPHESRGRLNIATCLVVGSIDTTMRVSVLNVPSRGRWSDPTRRMFSRSVPFHGGITTLGRAELRTGGGVSVWDGVSTGSSDACVEPDAVGVPESQFALAAASWDRKTHGSSRAPSAMRS